jgi:hypothetical protein
MSEWRRRRFIATTAATLGVSALPATGQGILPPAGEGALVANRSGLPWASGAITSGPDAFAAMRGRPLDILTTFGGRDTWAGIRNRANQLAPLLDPTMGNRQETIVVTYPMFPKEESPQTGGPAVWQRAAVGAFDAHHNVAAERLKRFPQRFIFRIGHEWNCCYPWACFDPALAPYYRDYFRRIVDLFRRHHPTCLIDWCSIKRTKTRVGINYFYPGRDWVDIIGHDKYDMWPPLRNRDEWDRDYMNTYRDSPQGIGAWLAFAKSKGKKLAVSEWGVNNGPDPPAGGGDNAYYVSRMLRFFKANAADMAYESYFNRNNTDLNRNHLLTPQDNPKSLAAYQTFFASQT